MTRKGQVKDMVAPRSEAACQTPMHFLSLNSISLLKKSALNFSEILMLAFFASERIEISVISMYSAQSWSWGVVSLPQWEEREHAQL